MGSRDDSFGDVGGAVGTGATHRNYQMPHAGESVEAAQQRLQLLHHRADHDHNDLPPPRPPAPPPPRRSQPLPRPPGARPTRPDPPPPAPPPGPPPPADAAAATAATAARSTVNETNTCDEPEPVGAADTPYTSARSTN